ncbi:MAG: type II secretion system protein [Minisyncoccales bacterium]
MQKTKGFTLIELLVVIAIIGILSGLIIVSMSGAQNAAKDARIKSAMDQMRSTAEVFKLNYNSYIQTADLTGTACPSSGNNSFLYGTGGTDGQSLCADITGQGGTVIINISASTSAPKYCIQSTLPSGTSSWCIDSTGAVGTTAGCSSTFTCAVGD